MRLYYKIKNRLKNMFSAPVTPPTYDLKRATIKFYKEKYGVNTLIETGTFFGETVEFFKKSFSKVYSIELQEDLAEKAKKLFENDTNVTILKGDSGEVLKTILPEIKEPILFWLDGHYSSEFMVGNELIKTARTNVDTPIVEELKTILSRQFTNVILIDDAREFTGIGDYPSIGQLRRLIRKMGGGYTLTVENDIIRILPDSAA